MEVAVLNRQSLPDIAVQVSGSIEAAFEIAAVNEIDVTDELTAKAHLSVPSILNKQITEYFRVNLLTPATGLSPADETLFDEGIEYWEIEFDFTIS
jgi:hypothetical protein